MTTSLRLTTTRLRLEPIVAGELDLLHAHWTDADVRRYLWDDEIISRESVAEIIHKSDELFGARRCGLWSIRRTVDGTLVGCGGFWDFHEPPETELIVSLGPTFWNRGFATESARVLITHAFDHLGWPHVQASTDAPNEPSVRLIHRIGMRPVCERPGPFGTTSVFRLTREQWLDTRQMEGPLT